MQRNSWFTVGQIDADTYVISEYKHWEETHCYLICGTDKAALIDTGLGVSDIAEVVMQITSLPITVLTSHVHWDHIGGHKNFENIAVHESEVEWLSEKFPLPLDIVKRNLMCKPCSFPSSFNSDEYTIFQGKPQRILHDNDRIDLGSRELTVIHTPGHSPGHCCFYEAERKYLFSGDLIYSGCLDAFYSTTDPRLFYNSVTKVRNLCAQRVLPAHHSLNISVGIINEIEQAFRDLDEKGNLEQGKGLFDFGEFQIHI